MTKDDLGSELAGRILPPLGLRGTRFDADQNMRSPAAHGYYRRDLTALDFSFAWAAGSMVSTARDVAHSYQALRHDDDRAGAPDVDLALGALVDDALCGS